MNAPSNEVKIGIVADVQYADAPSDAALNRYYPKALSRLKAAVNHFNDAGVVAVINLGDLIDHGFENFEPVMRAFAKSEAPVYHVPGNHDFEVSTDLVDEIIPTLAGEAGQFPRNTALGARIRLLQLDASRVSLFSALPGSARHLEATGWLSEISNGMHLNAKSYNGGLGEDQRGWLREQLRLADGAGERVIIACHQAVFGGREKFHLWDCEEVRTILSDFPETVMAWLAGHAHEASATVENGILHWQAAAMVDDEEVSAHAIMTADAESLNIDGHGRQPSSTWTV